MTDISPSDRELEALKVLWERREATVREIADAMNAGGEDLAYTTVLSLLQVMEQKGLVDHRRDGKAYVYVPKVERQSRRSGSSRAVSSKRSSTVRWTSTWCTRSSRNGCPKGTGPARSDGGGGGAWWHGFKERVACLVRLRQNNDTAKRDAKMNDFVDSFAYWLADYYLATTVLLAATLAIALCRQPVKRLALAKAAIVAAAALAGLCALPGWSVIHLLAARKLAEQPELIEQPIALASRSKQRCQTRRRCRLLREIRRPRRFP